MSGMKLFDNYEEDGQLSLFSADYDDWDEEWEEGPQEPVEESKAGNVTKSNSAVSAKAVTKAGEVAEVGSSTIGAAVDTYEKAVAGLEMTGSGPTVRVKYCASCGKLLFVREETAGFHSECNNCGIKYFQKLS